MKRTYAGIPEEFATFEKSKIAILPIPYDATSTYGKGADFGPEAFLEASENMEIYDLESDTEVWRKGIFLYESMICDGIPEIMVKQVKIKTLEIINSGKFFTMIGGEHSVSIGAIMAHNEKFQNLSVLQLDAHSDLRQSYNGSEFNHACAMHWASKNTNLIQVGIRSMDISEKPFVRPNNIFYAENIYSQKNWQQEVVNQLSNNVYLTIDLDCFDPSILPGTGTPEPGGLHWYETLELLKLLSKQKNIVGFDIVELAPMNNNKISEFFTAKLFYKILTYIFNTI
ncbi:MAG: agmatinase [Bacteroidales bacterium]|jgi:agmatinase|nr:agmatinase [Bacteroidales bacterium]